MKKRWIVVLAIVLMLGWCNRDTLNPFAPDCSKTPHAEGCKKKWSAPGLEL